jgi:hypothetical protein
VLGGVDGSLHLTVLSMNRLNQTETATFSIVPRWAFFRDSYFTLFDKKLPKNATDKNRYIQTKFGDRQSIISVGNDVQTFVYF